MYDTRTILCDLPNHIKGFTIVSEDFYTIVLNQNLSHEQNMETYQHEIDHINNGDFDKKCSVGLLEIFAHED